MDCKKCAEDLTAFMDAELSDEETEQIRSHLNACKLCADELLSLKESKEFIESHVDPLEPRPESWNLLRARISQESVSHSPSGFFILRWRVAAAALALIVASGLGYLEYQQTQKKTLDKYVSQYVQEREKRWQAKPVLANQPGAVLDETNPFAENPFVEIKATVSNNPFRSEDQ